MDDFTGFDFSGGFRFSSDWGVPGWMIGGVPGETPLMFPSASSIAGGNDGDGAITLPDVTSFADTSAGVAVEAVAAAPFEAAPEALAPAAVAPLFTRFQWPDQRAFSFDNDDAFVAPVRFTGRMHFSWL